MLKIKKSVGHARSIIITGLVPRMLRHPLVLDSVSPVVADVRTNPLVWFSALGHTSHSTIHIIHIIQDIAEGTVLLLDYRYR